MGVVETNNVKLTEKVDGTYNKIEAHSISIKELYELINKANEATQAQGKLIVAQEKRVG